MRPGPLPVDLILYPLVDFFRDPECAAAAEMNLLWKLPFLNHDVKSGTTDWNSAEHFLQLDQLHQL